MSNIFILTEGGGNFGMGHISRCLSLYQAFAEYGYSAKLIVHGDETILNTLSEINHLKLDWINRETDILSIVNNSDILIIDSYFCPVSLYQKFASISSTIAYIDDNLRLDYPSGIVINGVMCAEKLNYPKKNGRTYLLGHQY